MNLFQSSPASPPPAPGFQRHGAFFPSPQTLAVMAECGAVRDRVIACNYFVGSRKAKCRYAVRFASIFRRYAPYASQKVSL